VKLGQLALATSKKSRPELETVMPVTEYTRQDLWRKYSILQYITVMRHAWCLPILSLRCSMCQTGSCSSSSLEWVNGQYCPEYCQDTLLSQQY